LRRALIASTIITKKRKENIEAGTGLFCPEKISAFKQSADGPNVLAKQTRHLVSAAASEQKEKKILSLETASCVPALFRSCNEVASRLSTEPEKKRNKEAGGRLLVPEIYGSPKAVIAGTPVFQ